MHTVHVVFVLLLRYMYSESNYEIPKLTKCSNSKIHVHLAIHSIWHWPCMNSCHFDHALSERLPMIDGFICNKFESVQWNLSITDTLGTTWSVLIRAVSLFQRLSSTRRSLIERFHCIQVWEFCQLWNSIPTHYHSDSPILLDYRTHSN